MMPAENILLVSGGEIRYRLNRTAQRKKTMQVMICPPGEVFVSAPKHYSDRVVEDFLKKKSDWVIRKLRFFQNYSAHYPDPQAGRTGCLYLGQFYPLNLLEAHSRWGRIVFEDEQLTLEIPGKVSIHERKSYIQSFLLKWFKARAVILLKERVEKYAGLIGVQPSAVFVRSPRRLWGSCHPVKRTLHFNWKILMAPLETLDYIVVHELCHIKVPNHSKKFWELVAKYVPDFEEHHAWLKLNGHRLVLPQGDV